MDKPMNPGNNYINPTDPTMANTNNPIESNNPTATNTTNYVKTIKPMVDDNSIKKPLVYPFIEENDEYIRIFIYNPDAGKEGDLIHFYDKSYWDLVGLYPEVDVLDVIFPDDKDEPPTLQKGGQTGDKSEVNGPYEYFKGFMDLFFKPKDTDKNTLPNTMTLSKDNTNVDTGVLKETIVSTYMGNNENTNDKGNTENTPPYLLGLNPVKPVSTLDTQGNTGDDKQDAEKDITHGDKQDGEKEITIATTLTNMVQSSKPSTTNNANAIVLTFFPNNGFKFFVEVLQSRNPDIDIDITPSKYKFKELNKIEMIKKKKNLPTEISVEEVFYINGKLIVLKGMLNINANGAVKLASHEMLIESKKELSNFMMDKMKSFASDNPFF